MKNLALTFTILILNLGVTMANPTEEKKIKELINKAYVDGIHNNGNLDDTRNGFHPDFEMFINRNGNFSKLSINDWIKRIEANRAKNPNQAIAKAEADFIFIDITGNTASVKLELKKEGKTIFTDYLFLYKINDQWKIVSKVFHSH